MDPSGRFAYVPNAYGNNTVSEYLVDSSTGVLTPTAAGAVSTGNSPTSVAVDPSGKFAYVGNENDGTVSIYNINDDGSLPSSGTTAGGGFAFAISVISPKR